ncbi:hypothetical protein C5B42_03875 [Candidatus Cerribacteria bacterium 'Amazon FNV 2010 28 9']|uniref:Uncharacterized protein n=1 Tax=Candidatus Cerribacteria bacterium 'Amazon FNV 2010 28 9' TaxID=2081795 RepID=A0A317JPL2_9BACT|nr:MAG: hypothetical protein C5B42_03875 [Candidatus Cerribacteria bacterium 'Amazon FNV 2010 28 9']
MTIEQFQTILPHVLFADTSFDQKGWVASNPYYGHCAVVSLLAIDLFGGDLYRRSLEGTSFSQLHSHYWNALFDGSERDFTQQQFGSHKPQFLVVDIVYKEELLRNEHTYARYLLLKHRFEAYLETHIDLVK